MRRHQRVFKLQYYLPRELAPDCQLTCPQQLFVWLVLTGVLQVHAVCSNTEGSFECSCPDGYHGDGLTCADDRCLECPSNAGCFDTAIGVGCRCNTGFAGDGTAECLDVNECLGSPECTEHGVCVNTVGSFSCECDSGFIGDGNVVCEDQDECGSGGHDCDNNAVCNNTFGSYRCACVAGYAGSGVVCDNIDECAAQTHNCVAAVNTPPCDGADVFACWMGSPAQSEVVGRSIAAAGGLLGHARKLRVCLQERL